jgi:hypothetical protein
VKPLDALVDAVVRIIFAREAVELGESGIAASVLRDLEEDLAAVLAQASEEEAA